MVRGFETGSDNEKIDELQRQLDDIIDSQISSVGGNEDISIDSTRGSRNDASGDAGGVRSNEPIIHQITDVDSSGSSTGVFDKINLISSMIIVDFVTPAVDMELRFIQGTAKDGARIKITPKIGRTLIIKSGGDILTSNDITITDTEFYELVKHSETETGVTGGAYKIFLSSTGGTVNVPAATAQYQHLEANAALDWVAQQKLAFGANSPTAAQLNIPNNVIGIAWSNTANDDYLGISVDTNDKMIFNINAGNNVLELSATQIDIKTLDIVNIDRAIFVQNSGVVAGVNVPQIYVDNIGAGDLVINNIDTEAIIFTHSNVIGLQDTVSTLRKSRTNGLPIIQIVREGTVPAAGTSIADIRGLYPRTTGGETLASIISFTAEDTGNTTFEGGMAFQVNQIGSQNIFMRFNDGKNNLVDMFRDVDHNSNDVINVDRLQLSGGTTSATSVNDVVWYIDSTGDLISNVNVNDGWGWSVQNELKASFMGGIFEIQDDNSSSFSRIVNHISPVAIGGIGAFELSADNDTPTQLTMAFYAGSIVDVTSGGSGSAQIGVAQNGIQNDFIRINDTNDGNIKLLSNLDVTNNYIQLTEISTPAGLANTARLYAKEEGGNTKVFYVQSNGVEIGPLGPSAQTPWVSQIDAANNNLINLGDTTFNGAGSVMNVNGGDITGFDTLQASGGTSELNMVGGDIDMFGGKIIDIQDLTITFGKILSTSSVEFGIQLDDAASTTGSAGMLAMPQAIPPVVPTKADLDGFYGTHKGAMGIDTGLLPHLFVRSNNGDWFRFDVDFTVTV